MKPTTSNKKSSLWFGLDHYYESNSSLFFGRDEEIRQLSDYIFHNVQTIIYGPSGIGKTSIINAGLFKVARENGYLPVYIRLSHDSSSKQYFEQIIDAVNEAAKSHNVDIETALQYIHKEGNEYSCGSLWEYLHCNEFWTDDNHPIIPLIVIDQFEELFTLCQSPARFTDFFTQVSDLCDNKYPEYIKQYINKGENDRIDYRDTINYRFVISLREDYLARLEEQSDSIPSLKKNRFSLQCINDEQALEIITKPSPGLVSDDVAIRIIERVTNKKHAIDFNTHNKHHIYVEPSILSLFCSELDNKRLERGLNTISEDLVGEFGDNIIRDFYAECLGNLSTDKVDFLEEHLLTVDGFRDEVALQNVLRFGFTNEEVTALVDRRLIRSDNRDSSVPRLEFTHDVLCKVASQHREQREHAKQSQKIKLEEERKRQALLTQQEEERTIRNISYNRKLQATEKNVLIHKGRRLIDNALDFGENRCITDVAHQTSFDYILDLTKLLSQSIPIYFEDKNDCDFVNQRVFSDPLLKDSICTLHFYKDDDVTPTVDGLYGVKLKYKGAFISDIFFRGKKVLSDGSLSFDEPVYILGGYCGIHIDYDDKYREVQRTYLDESGYPISTIDGYCTIRIRYDELDNPVEIRYFNSISGEFLPAKHTAGNFGFNSIFDKNGNEVERYFVDESGLHTKILSEVYGKRMTYDQTTFRLTSISNIDSDGKLMADKDGYVTDKKFYDENGNPVKDLYFDLNGMPWKTPEGIFGDIDTIDYSQGLIVKHNLDEIGSYMSDMKGIYKTIMKVNDRCLLTEFYQVDSNDTIIDDDEKCAVQLWSYDEQNRLTVLKLLDNERKFISGFRLEYNKEGTHVIRVFCLSEDGLGLNDFGTVGMEFDSTVDGNRGLPVLQIFINEYKQYQTCNDGYNAVRTWNDEEGRVIKQMYFDIDGTPMTDDKGRYGISNEFIDDETTKCTHLDDNGKMIEDSDGVAYTITKTTASGSQVISYNKNGEPYEKDGWVYCNVEKKTNDSGSQEIVYIQDSNKAVIQANRKRLADAAWESILCSFTETNYDAKGRPLSQYFKDSNNCLVGDSTGDSYTVWEYNDDDHLEILSLYDVDDILKLRLSTKKDEKGRILERFYLDKNNNYVDYECGYSGEVIIYNDEQRMKTTSFRDSKGTLCNNNEGYASRIHWYDQYGRLVAQKDVNADGEIQGYISFKEYIDSERRECAYYMHREDVQGTIIANDSGFFYEYYEEDTKGRPIKQLYLNANKIPMSDTDGDYGLGYEYNERERLTIITCLDENGQPHNNNMGYGVIYLYKDENKKVVKRLYFTTDGEPSVYELGCYGFSYEYPNKQNAIIGYLNNHGEITTNDKGYAYKELCEDAGEDRVRVYYYDENRNNTQSDDDACKEFGYAIENGKNSRKIISLDKSGYEISNNACGYAIKREIYEGGKLNFYQFLDADGKPVADNAGDYGTEIQRLDNGARYQLVSLNKDLQLHVNDYGYSFTEVITDKVGDEVRIWRDKQYNEVIPKLRFTKRIQKFLLSIMPKRKALPVFNCRQIGAIDECVLGQIVSNHLGSRVGLKGTYVLLQYDNWIFGDNPEVLLNDILPHSIDCQKHIVFLPVTLDGSLLQDVGEILEFDFPKGLIGMRFKQWGINNDTHSIIIGKLKDRKSKNKS